MIPSPEERAEANRCNAAMRRDPHRLAVEAETVPGPFEALFLAHRALSRAVAAMRATAEASGCPAWLDARLDATEHARLAWVAYAGGTTNGDRGTAGFMHTMRYSADALTLAGAALRALGCTEAGDAATREGMRCARAAYGLAEPLEA